MATATRGQTRTPAPVSRAQRIIRWPGCRRPRGSCPVYAAQQRSVSMVVRGFHHTSFTVSDMERSLAFYRDLLGMQVVVDRRTTDTVPEHDHRLSERAAPHRLLAARRAGRPHPGADRVSEPPGPRHPCGRITPASDTSALWSRTYRRSMKSCAPPVRRSSRRRLRSQAGVNKGGYAVYLRDPDGSPLELLQPPAQQSSVAARGWSHAARRQPLLRGVSHDDL